MIEAEFIKALINAGVGAFLALLILVGLYRILNRVGVGLVDAQQAQASALASQAQSMAVLTRSIEEFIRRDNSEHREMIILLKVLTEKTQRIEESLT